MHYRDMKYTQLAGIPDLLAVIRPPIINILNFPHLTLQHKADSRAPGADAAVWAQYAAPN